MAGTVQERVDRLTNTLASRGDITSRQVEAAFRAVPRHRFLDTFFLGGRGGYRRVSLDTDDPAPEYLDLIYSDEVVVTRVDERGRPISSSSQPGLIAQMLEMLNLTGGMKILEVGAGTGYNAALMAEIVGPEGHVVTVDIQEDVIEQARRQLLRAGFEHVEVVAGDGTFGWKRGAPYDRIVATVGTSDLSPHWVDQLDMSGRMLLPISYGGSTPLVEVRRFAGETAPAEGRVVGMSGFMPTTGELSADGRERTRFRQSPQRVAQVWPELTPVRRVPFWFYLAISDDRTDLMPEPGRPEVRAWSGWSFGLSSTEGRVIVGSRDVWLQGDDRLWKALDEAHARWVELGMPMPADFRIAFYPSGRAPEGEGSVVKRTFHDHLFRLP